MSFSNDFNFFFKAIQMYFLKQRFLEITNILRLEVPLIKHNFFFRVKCFQSSFQKEKKMIYFFGFVKREQF